MAQTFPSVVIQSFITITAKRWGQFPTISFTNNGTAGSEIVTVTGTSNVTVQIQSGVTTMLQLKTAIDNSTATTGFSGADLISVAITAGHNSDVVLTLNQVHFHSAVTSAQGSFSGFLGSASLFTVLAKSTITNSGSTVITGNLGLTPGSSVTGFPPGTISGATHIDDPVAVQAQTDATAAAVALTATGPGTDLSSTDLGGHTCTPGTYFTSAAATWSAGNLTLNGAGTYVFLIGTSITLPANGSIVLSGGATENNVYFVTGTTFIFGANSTVYGQILAGSAITTASNTVMHGRLITQGASGTAITFPSAATVSSTPYSQTSVGSGNASVRIGDLTYTAVASGTAGNGITVHYTSGATAGSEIVSVSGTDITVQISDTLPTLSSYTPFTYPKEGVNNSSPQQVQAAVAASGPASALVTVTENAPTIPPFDNSSTPDAGVPDSRSGLGVLVTQANPLVTLGGGVNGTPATLTVQGITITSITNDATQNGATFTATEGGTAGSEVVTMSGNNISIQIQNGVSTVTQIRTALNATPAFTALYVASGTSSTAVFTVNNEPLTGAVGG